MKKKNQEENKKLKEVSILLKEYAETLTRIGDGFGTESLSYKLIAQGAVGASIKSTADFPIPLPWYKAERRLIKAHIALHELPTDDIEVVKIEYYIDNYLSNQEKERHRLSKYKKSAYYDRLRNAKIYIADRVQKIRLES